MNVQTDRGVKFLHDFTSVCASPLHQLEATLDAVQVQLTHFGSSYINMTALFSFGCFTGSFSYLFYIKNRNTYLKPTTIIICSEILSNYMCKYAPNDQYWKWIEYINTLYYLCICAFLYIYKKTKQYQMYRYRLSKQTKPRHS